MRASFGLVLALVLTSGPLLACSASSHANADTPDAGPIEECEAFLTAYEHCLGMLGPADVASARVEQTRAGLAAQLTSGGAAARPALQKTCADNLSQLKTSCR